MNKVRLLYSFLFFPLIVGIFLSSCKTQENTVKVKVKINHRSTKFLVKKLIENEFEFDTFSTKASVSYDNGEKVSFKAYLRIRKDSVIWVSIKKTVEVARILITKDTIKFMDRMKNEYFISEFDYINKLFGSDLDYQMLEALLIGNSLEFEKDEKIKSSIDRKKDTYFLSTAKKRKIRKEIKKEKGKFKEQIQAIWLDPLTFKIKELLLSSPESKQSLKTVYSNYKEVEKANNQLFPHTIAIKLNSKVPSTIDVNYNKISVGKALSYSFKIPKKYEQLEK